jgi:hypothetical protein
LLNIGLALDCIPAHVVAAEVCKFFPLDGSKGILAQALEEILVDYPAVPAVVMTMPTRCSSD